MGKWEEGKGEKERTASPSFNPVAQEGGARLTTSGFAQCLLAKLRSKDRGGQTWADNGDRDAVEGQSPARQGTILSPQMPLQLHLFLNPLRSWPRSLCWRDILNSSAVVRTVAPGRLLAICHSDLEGSELYASVTPSETKGLSVGPSGPCQRQAHCDPGRNLIAFWETMDFSFQQKLYLTTIGIKMTVGGGETGATLLLSLHMGSVLGPLHSPCLSLSGASQLPRMRSYSAKKCY